MKEIFITFAKQNEEADKAFVSLLDKISNDEREKNRKSYYGAFPVLCAISSADRFTSSAR